jgi:L-rhamnonate dehydratase
VVDLAIWDLLGKIRGEPIYKMIGGRTKKDIPLYLTGPRPEVAKELGFWGSKVALPHGPSDGHEGIRKNVAYLKECKDAVGPDYPVQVDCYMSLDVPYTIALIRVSTNLIQCRTKADGAGYRESRGRDQLVGGGPSPR